MKRTSITLLVLCALAAPATYAQSVETKQLPQAGAATSQSAMAEAEVRKVDKDAAKITLKHGEIKNLEMPGMTMVFQVKDPALLEKIKAGDQVSFTADKVNGAYTVLSIEPRK